VVGAGVAGLAAARRMHELRPDIEVALFEIEDVVGGRATSQNVLGAEFDPGAQYVRTPTPELERLLTSTLGHETLVDIGLPVWTSDGVGAIQPGDPLLDAGAKWTYSDGLSRLALELSRGSTVYEGIEVSQLDFGDAAITLVDSRGHSIAQARAVLLTPPGPA